MNKWGWMEKIAKVLCFSDVSLELKVFQCLLNGFRGYFNVSNCAQTSIYNQKNFNVKLQKFIIKFFQKQMIWTCICTTHTHTHTEISVFPQLFFLDWMEKMTFAKVSCFSNVSHELKERVFVSFRVSEDILMSQTVLICQDTKI